MQINVRPEQAFYLQLSALPVHVFRWKKITKRAQPNPRLLLSSSVVHMIHVRAHAVLQVMDKEGARLTTYRFTSPSGGVFSYTVENDSEPGGGVEGMEAWEAEEASRDMWKKASVQQVM